MLCRVSEDYAFMKTVFPDDARAWSEIGGRRRILTQRVAAIRRILRVLTSSWGVWIWGLVCVFERC